MMHKPLISADLIVIDGDRGKNYPKQEDFMTSGHCIFLNATNVTKNGFDFSECIFISEEKNNILGKGIVKANDIVLTTRGKRWSHPFGQFLGLNKLYPVVVMPLF